MHIVNIFIGLFIPFLLLCSEGLIDFIYGGLMNMFMIVIVVIATLLFLKAMGELPR